jgi:pyruvate formate lyase activating enzyme
MKTFNIFQVQRWSIHDGDGIRSTVFFKGCPLRCKWCANPESWYQKLELMVYEQKCRQCKRCLAVCEHGAITQSAAGKIQFDHAKCVYCQKCLAVCMHGARKHIGESVTVEEVMQMIRKDCIFYQESGGGVTFSGGEPFMQGSYLRQLVSQCHAMGIDTAVETSAYFDFAENQDIIAALDAIFIDIKHMDDEIHQALTGVSNQKILENIKQISKLQQNIIIRVPLIREVNATEKNIRSTCEFLREQTTIKQIELLPYHMLGEHKMEALGIVVQAYTTPTEEEIKNLEQIIESYDLSIVKF